MLLVSRLMLPIAQLTGAAVISTGEQGQVVTERAACYASRAHGALASNLSREQVDNQLNQATGSVPLEQHGQLVSEG